MSKHWFKLLSGRIEKATRESAAFDLFYNGTEPILVGDKPVIIPTGVRTKFSRNLVAVIKEKSGLGVKGVEVKAGVIDADYAYEWGVVLRFPRQKIGIENDKGGIIAHEKVEHFRVNPGDKVAQFLLLELPDVDLCDEDGTGTIVISDQVREGGFGSTGK